jgi:membrane protease YdiL (CAAX protease family)
MDSQIAIIIFIAIILPKPIKIAHSPEILPYYLIALVFTFFLAILTAIYTYKNYNEVISRRFRWRSSNVDIFSARLKYTISRFFASMIIYSVYVITLISFISNKP